MLNRFLLCSVCSLVLLAARPASAQFGQPWNDRGYANFNVGFESTSGTLNDAATLERYGEGEAITSSSAVDSGAFVDFSIGSRVWQNVSVGIGYHRESTTGQGTAAGQIPHPLLFGAHRVATASAGDLGRTEQAIHVQVGYMLVLDERFDVHLTIGPSFFRLKQDVISGFNVEEQGGNFAAVNTSIETAERTDSTLGVNFGADVAYRLYDSIDWRLGAGVFLRYTAASAEIRLLENTVDSDVGGLQIGFGLRARF